MGYFSLNLLAVAQKNEYNGVMRNFLSESARRLEPSSFLNYFGLADGDKQLISLGVGEPDFKTPKKVRRAALKLIKRGNTQYTGCRGLLELRQLVSRYLFERFAVDYPAENTVITIGASEAVDLALRAICDAGDEILLPEPYYVSYAPAVALAGGVPVPVRCDRENGFIPTAQNIQKAITEKTKAIILSYPNNPTGAVVSREGLEEIASVVRQNDLLVISDEIYAELNYTGKHYSIAALPQMKERTIYIGGFSKSFAMTGWRVGYICCPDYIDKAVVEIHTHTIICAPRMGQAAAIEALKDGFAGGFAFIEEMRRDYAERGRVLAEWLNALGLTCTQPQGAFYVFANVESTGLDGDGFAERLIKEAKVAVVPGSAFGEAGRNYVRCSYAASMQNIKVALERLADFLKGIS